MSRELEKRAGDIDCFQYCLVSVKNQSDDYNFDIELVVELVDAIDSVRLLSG